jgi:hypothetical protein
MTVLMYIQISIYQTKVTKNSHKFYSITEIIIYYDKVLNIQSVTEMCTLVPHTETRKMSYQHVSGNI